MKKILVAISVLFIVSIVFSHCKSENKKPSTEFQIKSSVGNYTIEEERFWNGLNISVFDVGPEGNRQEKITCHYDGDNFSQDEFKFKRAALVYRNSSNEWVSIDLDLGDNVERVIFGTNRWVAGPEGDYGCEETKNAALCQEAQKKANYWRSIMKWHERGEVALLEAKNNPRRHITPPRWVTGKFETQGEYTADPFDTAVLGRAHFSVLLPGKEVAVYDYDKYSNDSLQYQNAFNEWVFIEILNFGKIERVEFPLSKEYRCGFFDKLFDGKTKEACSAAEESLKYWSVITQLDKEIQKKENELKREAAEEKRKEAEKRAEEKGGAGGDPARLD